MSYNEFVTACAEAITKRPRHIREGQAAFNFLTDVRPELATKLVLESLDHQFNVDPFFVDDNLPRFYEWLHQNWK